MYYFRTFSGLSLKFCYFSYLCKICCSAGVLPAWCMYTHYHRGKTEKARVQNILKSLKKNTIFNEHPVCKRTANHTYKLPLSIRLNIFSDRVAIFSRIPKIIICTRYFQHFVMINKIQKVYVDAKLNI